MTRTRQTATTKLGVKWGTSSGMNPGEDFEEPEDLSDLVGIDTSISRGSRGGSGSGLDFPSTTTGGLDNEIPRNSRAPTRGALGGKPALSPGKPPLAPSSGIDLTKDPPGAGNFDAGKKTPNGGLRGKPQPRSPIGIEAGKSAGGGLGIVVSLPLGGGPISGRGGINIGAGGAIKGGSIGLGFGLGPIGGSIDVGVDQDEKTGQGGCYQYVTLTVGPFSHTYGRNVCEPKQPRSSDSESSSPEIPTIPGIGSQSEQILPLLQDNKCYHVVILSHVHISNEFTWTPDPNVFVRASLPEEVHGGGVWQNSQNRFYAKNVNLPYNRTPAFIESHEPPNVPLSKSYDFPDEFKKYKGNFKVWASLNSALQIIIPNGYKYNEVKPAIRHITDTGLGIKNYVAQWKPAAFIWDLSVYEIPCNLTGDQVPKKIIPPVITPPSTSSPPIPNSPPKKKMDDKCCKASLALQIETLKLLGREVGANGELGAMNGAAGLLGEKIKRTQTPITDGKRPQEIEISFPTIYQLLAYLLKQSNDLDTALDPKSYKIPTGYISNPEYSRDSEQSLKDNKQPSKDKAGKDRELKINDSDKAKMGGFLEQQQYMFNALRRLEYLFPSGELSDALIAKSLLIPGAKGDIKIHNMIMAYEIQMQYLDAALGNPREKLVIKDANPAIEGDQPIEVTSLSISDLLRQNIKFHIDTGGDVDALVNLVLRDFRTNLANRIDLIKSAEMVQALFEDSGMLEKQEYIDVHLEGDVYAGQWIKGQGFKANPNLEKKTEEATEEVLRATMKPVDQKIKVSRRSKDEKTDLRDLLRGLADFIQRLVSIPSAGNAGKAIDKLVESAKFKVQTDMALLRQNVTQAAAASRNRTKKRKK